MTPHAPETPENHAGNGPSSVALDELLEARSEEIAHAITVALDEGLTDPNEITLATALVAFPSSPDGRRLAWPPPRGRSRQRALWERLGLIVRLALSTPREEGESAP